MLFPREEHDKRAHPCLEINMKPKDQQELAISSAILKQLSPWGGKILWIGMDIDHYKITAQSFKKNCRILAIAPF
ncbi:MAG: hypothetical protein A2Z14_15735 [Chloroflexi bacterium RBG_16_48_8]|nr:MAG: hypothetical protein A2Z14_15735 [Chloroflexi bacterium RBG_16_48_8]